MQKSSSPRASRTRSLALTLMAGAVLLITGCGHRHQAYAPPPPPAPSVGAPAAVPAPEEQPSSPSPSYSRPSRRRSADESFVETHRPIFTETGLASWYGPPYNRRRGADGRIYDENQLSAANRTLPLGSLIKVTNVRTGQSAVMRVTDRGPFVGNRILDLSLAAAKAVGVWRAGVAEVRLDVYSSPAPLSYGGRWCVQIGAFTHKGAALHLEQKLEREYRTANVIEFRGPTGYWVRIRPANDNRAVAVQIAHRVRPVQGKAWLVRLD